MSDDTFHDAYDILLVGSGAAGTAAALELSAHPLHVGILDVGHCPDATWPSGNFYDFKKCPSEYRNFFLGKHHEYLQAIKEEFPSPKKRPPLFKYVFRDEETLFPRRYEGFQGNISLAFGGLANIWGAQLLRFDAEDLRSFPFSIDALTPFYERLDEEIGICGENDDLVAFYGRQDNLLPPLKLLRSGKTMLESYVRHRHRLNAAGIWMGRPRAGIATVAYNGRPAHAYEAMEFFKPGISSIYTPPQTLRKILKRNGPVYLPGMQVLRFVDQEHGVHIIARELQTDAQVELKARCLVLCAGALGSAKIVLTSLAHAGSCVPLGDNALSFVPLVNPLLLGCPQEREAIYMQLNLCLKKNEQPMIMGTLYAITGLLLTDFLSQLPLAMPQAVKILPYLTPAMQIMQVWHAVRPDTTHNKFWLDENGIAHIHYEEFRDGKSERYLLRNLLRLGWIGLPGLIQYVRGGSSFHYGGTLPLREHPEDLECHPSGLLQGTRHVYVADGSVFPIIPAKNLSYSIMANAMRTVAILAKHFEKTSL